MAAKADNSLIHLPSKSLAGYWTSPILPPQDCDSLFGLKFHEAEVLHPSLKWQERGGSGLRVVQFNILQLASVSWGGEGFDACRTKGITNSPVRRIITAQTDFLSPQISEFVMLNTPPLPFPPLANPFFCFLDRWWWRSNAQQIEGNRVCELDRAVDT